MVNYLDKWFMMSDIWKSSKTLMTMNVILRKYKFTVFVLLTTKMLT